MLALAGELVHDGTGTQQGPKSLKLGTPFRMAFQSGYPKANVSFTFDIHPSCFLFVCCFNQHNVFDHGTLDSHNSAQVNSCPVQFFYYLHIRIKLQEPEKGFGAIESVGYNHRCPFWLQNRCCDSWLTWLFQASTKGKSNTFPVLGH